MMVPWLPTVTVYIEIKFALDTANTWVSEVSKPNFTGNICGVRAKF